MSAERPILVLLHPFPMDASFWGPMWRELAADVTLLTPEFPGFGGEPPSEGATVDGVADQAADAILRAGGTATVVGLSLGGYVALSLAARHPQRVDALVLANTRAEADDPDGRRARDRAIDTIRIDGLDAYLATLLPRLVGPSAADEVLARAEAIAHRQDPESVCAALEALRDRPDRRPDLGAIRHRTVVVAGADDTVTPPATARALADAITGAELRIIADAGHLSALEQPGAFAGIVRDVLAGADP